LGGKTDVIIQKLIEANWDAEFGSKEAEELDALTTLVESYEEANHAIEATVPVEVSKKTGATDE
jgi:antitoxin component HigA of HigAB toxin-antitoxin module